MDACHNSGSRTIIVQPLKAQVSESMGDSGSLSGRNAILHQNLIELSKLLQSFLDHFILISKLILNLWQTNVISARV